MYNSTFYLFLNFRNLFAGLLLVKANPVSLRLQCLYLTQSAVVFLYKKYEKRTIIHFEFALENDSVLYRVALSDRSNFDLFSRQ